MHRSALQALDEDESFDICIIGSGPAGMTLALRLIGTGLKICVLESGDVDGSPQPHELNRGVITNRQTAPPYDLTTSRMRGVGGTSGLWDVDSGGGENHLGRLAPLQGDDFEVKPWLDHSGWPLGADLLDPYVLKAAHLWNLSPDLFDETHPMRSDPAALFDGDVLESTPFVLANRDVFGNHGRSALERAKNVVLITNATATELRKASTGDVISGVRVVLSDGSSRSVAATVYVVAAGGIENARLLLNSDENGAATAIGNAHDLVGRFFMEHPVLYLGWLYPRQRTVFDRAAFYDIRTIEQGIVMGHLRLRTSLKRREQLLGVGLLLHPLSRSRTRLGRAVGRVGRLLLHRRQWDARFDITRGGWSHEPPPSGRFRCFHVFGGFEQAPDPHNRVTLLASRDSSGMRRVSLDWRWNEPERRTLRRVQELIGHEVERGNAGRFFARTFEEENLPLRGAHHHLGTTRMHASPHRGVVDSDCRVHGVANLYMAGGSVFPTGGYVNPTLTLAALAVRLAEHIEQELTTTVRLRDD